MALDPEDRTAVTELLALHGHLTDAGELDRLGELFTPDVVYDITDFGQPPLHGPAAIRDAALALGAGNPVAHHITNVVLTELAEGRVHALSKGIGINADGTSGSVTYEDTVVRGDDGWRIAHRKVGARRVPLGGR
ncbi:nuclear transport factor 2 family protein [Streptomyces sp. SID8379]|uniref:nuclear transport factor 2 family protein n=1 Tax=unclassified Streptomyces TaxID=2593676 RepID=UPI00036F2022|nr:MULTISPECIES: nuclear transport factor 2 family protein [unclassified Streptomyces]MYW63682.1 nuclear transport factor 2 family protein [Streptomyces sp. SID8379]